MRIKIRSPLIIKSGDDMNKLKNYIYYYGGETKDENLKTAEYMSVFFGRKQKYSEPAYMYESLIFINKLIRASKTA